MACRESRRFAAYHEKGPQPAKESEAGFGVMISNDPLIVGYRRVWGGGEVPFGIAPLDARYHCYVIGKTGSGKTTLLRNLIVQHIERGHGVGVIDPHGDLAEELLHYIPRRRTDDLVYFDPGDLEHPIGLNLLANVPADERPLVASGIVEAFHSIWGESWGPRMAYILYNAIAALLDCPNTSLLGINRLLTDSVYRSWVVRRIRDPFIKRYWEEEFESYEPRFLREAIAPIQNKVGSLLQSPVIRNILGQVRSMVQVPSIMDRSHIFIANLSKGRIGQDKSNLLGSLLVAQFQLAAMARSRQPEEERRDFFLFIDEFQNFSTDSFTSILAEARKYRLSLTLSHQYVAQLPLAVRDAVFGNAGTIICFRVGHSDAESLSQELGNEFPPSQFVDLPPFEAMVRLYQSGQSQAVFSSKISRPSFRLAGKPEILRSKSRERYSEKRSSVEEKIARWMAA